VFDWQGRSAKCDVFEIIVDFNNCPVLFHVITLLQPEYLQDIRNFSFCYKAHKKFCNSKIIIIVSNNKNKIFLPDKMSCYLTDNRYLIFDQVNVSLQSVFVSMTTLQKSWQTNAVCCLQIHVVSMQMLTST
jgi:hypothetical protein